MRLGKSSSSSIFGLHRTNVQDHTVSPGGKCVHHSGITTEALAVAHSHSTKFYRVRERSRYFKDLFECVSTVPLSFADIRWLLALGFVTRWSNSRRMAGVTWSKQDKVPCQCGILDPWWSETTPLYDPLYALVVAWLSQNVMLYPSLWFFLTC